MYIELTQNALSTILIDCIQYYPDKKNRKEAYGLILGTENTNFSVGEYTFPVGNVLEQSQGSVTASKKIDNIIKQTKQIVATTACVASYHSHPYEEYFNGWANPSNGDCHAIIGGPTRIELIVALTQTKTQKNAPIRLSYLKQGGLVYYKNNNPDDFPPDHEAMNEPIQYIHGVFLNYFFEVRAYWNTGKELKEINLYSSEVVVNELLTRNEIDAKKLSSEEMYRIKKMEYGVRLDNLEKSKDNVNHHLAKLSKQDVPVEFEFNDSTFVEIESLSLDQIKNLIPKKALYITKEYLSSGEPDTSFYLIEMVEIEKIQLVSLTLDGLQAYPIEYHELINKRYNLDDEGTKSTPLKLWVKKGF